MKVIQMMREGKTQEIHHLMPEFTEQAVSSPMQAASPGFYRLWDFQNTGQRFTVMEPSSAPVML